MDHLAHRMKVPFNLQKVICFCVSELRYFLCCGHLWYQILLVIVP